jgi:hypothetical protein
MHARVTAETMSPGEACQHLLRTIKAHMQDTFEGGVTNGNSWYPVFGGMQDWLYLVAGTLEVTLELSQTKWPKGPELQAVWDDSREALLQYPLRAVFGGVHGTVRTPGGGAAEVTVATGGLQFLSDPVFGTFYRALGPGKHTLVFRADGMSAQRTVVVPAEGNGVELLVDLRREAHSNELWQGPEVGPPFPFVVLAGRLAPTGQLHTVSQAAFEVEHDGGEVNLQRGVEQLSRVDHGGGGLRAAGRWTLLVGGIVWMGYKVALYRSGRWPGMHRSTSRRHDSHV